MHTITLMRDDNRLGHHYGEHYYVERMGQTIVKIEYIGTDGEHGTHDRDQALVGATATAKVYGAKLIDRTPADHLYGFSAG